MFILVLSFAAGVLTTLSPCVFPMLPIVVGSSLSTNRFGPLAMAVGLTLSFVVLGIGVALLGASFSFDPSYVRYGGAFFLALAGFVLLVPRVQELISQKLLPISNRAQGLTRNLPQGLLGQFFLGGALGAIWSPCSGPTLGAALTLASQAKNLPWAGLQMTLFGVGASLPLVVVGYVSRQWVIRGRARATHVGQFGKMALGGILIAVSLLIVTGFDKRIEAAVLDHLPESWINFTTSL